MRPIGLDPGSFLRDHWQRRPLLLKGAVPGFSDPLSPEELAGLACEEEVEARLVFHEPPHWRLQSGPFSEEDFLALPERDWTLLVQSVDLWRPDLKRLFSLVDFLPAWRRDDLMISFATAGAGTGPHFDYYDVFILQGQGHRRWQLGQWCDATTCVDTRSGMKILQDFSPTETLELEPGDLLYIPAGVAHYGISHDDSLSYSIGFRAPSAAELLVDLAHEAQDSLSPDQRYGDASIVDFPTDGRVSTDMQQHLRRLIETVLENPALLASSFCRHMTRPRHPELMPGPEALASDDDIRALADSGKLIRNPASRFAWFTADNGGKHSRLTLVCDAECYELTDTPQHRAFLATLSSETANDPDCAAELQTCVSSGSEALKKLTRALYNNGTLISRDELEDQSFQDY